MGTDAEGRRAKRGRRLALLATLGLGAGCASAPRIITLAPASYEAISLRGDTLREVPTSEEARVRNERLLADARRAFEHTPTNVDSIIWYARRVAYLGRFRQAINIYSGGVQLHPDNPWLFRHRGHRLISIRMLDEAVKDLERAAALTAGKPDEVEPDGQPNAQNVPIGTLQSNIDYHLALAYYLRGDYARALPIYERELRNARNNDRRVSIAYWYYLALRKLGRASEAAALLKPIAADLSVIENDSYKQMLLAFKGVVSPDSLLASVSSNTSSVPFVTIGYGIGTWHLLNGNGDRARRIYEQIVGGGQWPAFGYIAAEAELTRRQP